MSPDQTTCEICKRQFAIYTCPSCNIPYCSLSCFRSSVHEQCSESFYKKELETDIQTTPSKSTEDKRRMMELLKKFEEESMNDQLNGLGTTGEYDSDDEGPHADLAKRLKDVDLESVDSDTLWSLLNAEERSRFLHSVEDPNSEPAQQLLHSEELEKGQQKPWWEGRDIEREMTWPAGTTPVPILIPASMVKPVPSSTLLVYNMCAICISYSYTVRHLATSSLSNISLHDPDRGEALRVISQLVPFLVERRSTVRFSSIAEVIADVWPRFDKGGVPSPTFAALLGDCASLMKPLPVTPVAAQLSTSAIDPRFHPHCRPIWVLSDLSKFTQGAETRSGKLETNHITQKLLFYAAHILSTPSHVLHLVTSQLLAKSQCMLREDKCSNSGAQMLPDNRTKKAQELTPLGAHFRL